MDLKKLLSVNMAALAVLGTFLLVTGQRNAGAAVAVWVAAAISVVVTDFLGWFRLHRNVAAVAALGVVIFFLRRFLRIEGEFRILVLADLLIWLQVLFLFQEKDQRVYWWLAMMSLLQVLVAAGLDQGVGFGALLTVYMFTGLSAMTLLFLHSQMSRYESGNADGPGEPASPVPPRPGARWPLAAAPPVFSGPPAGVRAEGIVRELFIRMSVLGGGTLFLALVIFFTVPRLGKPAWRGAMIAEQKAVGFNDKVELGDLGPSLQDRAEVMRVKLIETESGRPYPVGDALYLRGAVATHYENNQWSRGPSRRREGRHALGGIGRRVWDAARRVWETSGEEARDARGPEGAARPSVLPRFPIPPERLVPSPVASGETHLRPPPAAPSSVLQRIVVEPLNREEVFCLWPFAMPLPDDPKFYRDDENEKIHYDPYGERLLRLGRHRRERTAFTLRTTALAEGEQTPLTPCDKPPADVEALLQLPDLPRLAALAGQWTAESGLLPDDFMNRAALLEWQLAESGQFQYSLQGQERDAAIDAVEDFVSNHPRGHCEYFATALALMLRSQGIPSRVVLGYRCDEWDGVNQCHQVRQLHAHAWVEAYLDPWHLPAELQGRGAKGRWRHGAWLRLDGTPAGSIGSTAADRSTWGRWQRRAHWLQSLWNHYVVEMDRKRQQETVFQPVRGLLKDLRDPEWWRATFGKIGAALRLSSWSSIGAWLLGVVLPLVVGLLLLAAVTWGLWRAGRRLWRRWRARAAAAAPRSQVEFYGRLEHLLARRGLARAAGETPREFALSAGPRLAGQCGREELAPLPLAVAEAFYQVRFGGYALEPAQAAAVEQALAELERAETAPRAGKP